MATRRQEKIARIITESVSDTISHRLSDPRIIGLVSVTEVTISPDIKNATVFLSIMSPDETQKQKTFDAIRHAAGPIQARLGRALTGRFCPHLRFELDQKLHNTLQTLRLIAQAAEEFSENRTPQVDETDFGPEEPLQ